MWRSSPERRPLASSSSPTTTCTTTNACAPRSRGQNASDGRLRSHSTAPHPAARALEARTPIPNHMWNPVTKRPFALCSKSAQGALYIRPAVLKAYVPALVFLALGIGVGGLLVGVNSMLGPKRPNPAKRRPYESGLPSEVKKSFRFGISFYLLAMLFILFDIEVIFLYPVALQLKAFGAFALVETAVFVALLLVALAYVWRRGALEWR